MAHVPEEIVRAFVHCLSADRSSVSSCALVCRSWTPVAQAILYRVIFFHADVHTFEVPYSELRHILNESPHLAVYVRHIDLRIGNAYIPLDNCREFLAPILAMFSNVETLKLNLSFQAWRDLPGDFLRSLQSVVSSPSFENLHILRSTFAGKNGSDLAAFLKHCAKTLRYLSISDAVQFTGGEGPEDQPHQVELAQLRSFYAGYNVHNGPFPIPKPWVRWIDLYSSLLPPGFNGPFSNWTLVDIIAMQTVPPAFPLIRQTANYDALVGLQNLHLVLDCIYKGKHMSSIYGLETVLQGIPNAVLETIAITFLVDFSENTQWDDEAWGAMADSLHPFLAGKPLERVTILFQLSDSLIILSPGARQDTTEKKRALESDAVTVRAASSMRERFMRLEGIRTLYVGLAEGPRRR